MAACIGYLWLLACSAAGFCYPLRALIDKRPHLFYSHATALCVQIDAVSKVYPSSLGAKVAVRTTSLGIPRGECFGLLGINGAGKSSILSILSGVCWRTFFNRVLSRFFVRTGETIGYHRCLAAACMSLRWPRWCGWVSCKEQGPVYIRFVRVLCCLHNCNLRCTAHHGFAFASLVPGIWYLVYGNNIPMPSNRTQERSRQRMELHF